MTLLATMSLLADSSYWARFKDFWLGSLNNANNVVLFVLGVGAVALLIITSNKWIK
jgi:hypothetical protein